jgi:hypothetical protein
MEKWNINNFGDYLKEERQNCYWFWFKGKIKRTFCCETGLIIDNTLPYWNGIRFRNGFNNCFDILTYNYMRGLKEGKYNGQTKSEFEKNYKRVKDIIDKSAGDVDKMKTLAQTQANRITDEWKAINRAMSAKEMGYEEVFEVFFQRAYELGSVSKGEYREYKLEKLGL